MSGSKDTATSRDISRGKPDGADVSGVVVGVDDVDDVDELVSEDTTQPLLPDHDSFGEEKEENPHKANESLLKESLIEPKDESPFKDSDESSFKVKEESPLKDITQSITDSSVLPGETRLTPIADDKNPTEGTEADKDITHDDVTSFPASQHGDDDVSGTTRDISISADDNKQQTTSQDSSVVANPSTSTIEAPSQSTVKKPVSPTGHQTKSTENNGDDVDDSWATNPGSKRNPTGITSQSPCAIEYPDEQTIERSQSGQTPTVEEVPNTNILVACLITVCFNLPLGVLAVYYSLMAAKAYRDGMRKKGARRARIAMWINLFAIVVTVLIVMSVVLWMAVRKRRGKPPSSAKTTFSF